MNSPHRSVRRHWLVRWAALCFLTVVALVVASRSGNTGPLIAVSLTALALACGLAFLMVRAQERGLRALRQYTADLAASPIELSLPGAFSGEAGAAQAVNSLAADLRARLDRLRQERDQLAVLLEFGTEGLLQISASGRILHVNPAAARLIGLPADARGQSILALVRHAELRDLLLTAARGDVATPTEVVLEDRQLFVMCRSLPDGGGAVTAIIDLTPMRRLEAVRRDFVANVSHELKTPLTSIRGYTETLMADDLPPDMRRQFLDVVQKNTTRIQRIVDDLLDLSRLQSGGWSPMIQDVDAAELASDTWAACADSARNRKIDFAVAATGPTHVAADPGGLRQVLANLYDNALRYTSAGGRIHVRIQPVNGNGNGRPADWIEIQVQDTGSGIPREALPRIFERFYRVDPARSRAEGGTGLGLSIVKHLVERMEGEVSAESELGKGTTIRVRLRAA